MRERVWLCITYRLYVQHSFKNVNAEMCIEE